MAIHPYGVYGRFFSEYWFFLKICYNLYHNAVIQSIILGSGINHPYLNGSNLEIHILRTTLIGLELNAL